jgi:hypothetical protein
VYSKTWRLGQTTTGEACGWLGRGCLLEDQQTTHPAVTINRVGDGLVAYVPADIFRDFQHNRYPLTRTFIGGLINRLMPDPDILVSAPPSVDVTLRQRGNTRFIHFVNRSSGIPNLPNNGAIDNIPSVGPVSVRMRLEQQPHTVGLALESGELEWSWDNGVLAVRISAVAIHCALQVEC